MKTPYTLKQDAEYIAGMAKVWSKELEIIQAMLAKSENIFESIKLKRVIKEINEPPQVIYLSCNPSTQAPQLYLKCEKCENIFKYNGHKRKRWCSDKCKVRAWRNKRKKV